LRFTGSEDILGAKPKTMPPSAVGMIGIFFAGFDWNIVFFIELGHFKNFCRMKSDLRMQFGIRGESS
jgi:hypothetical protein